MAETYTLNRATARLTEMDDPGSLYHTYWCRVTEGRASVPGDVALCGWIKRPGDLKPSRQHAPRLPDTCIVCTDCRRALGI